MGNFVVEAVNPQGQRVNVNVEAATSQDALAKVMSKGLKPIGVKEKAGGSAGAKKEAPAPSTPSPATTTSSLKQQASAKKAKGRGIVLFERVKQKELSQFTSQLSILINAGLPIVRSLKILSNQMKRGLLKDIVGQVAEDVETGVSLSEALARHPKAFDKLYVNMIKAGEAGGILDVILQRLAGFMEKAEVLKKKVIGAAIYPAVVMGVAVGVVFIIMAFIVPKFTQVFQQAGVGELPVLTQFLIASSDFTANYWYILFLIPIAALIGLSIWSKTAIGRLMIDRFKLRMPLFGVILKKSVIARFARTLGTLLQSGVPILDALNIIKNAIGNKVLENAITHTHDSIREGEGIAGPLGESKVFDDMVINMIDVGEETGELDKMLLKIADVYDFEVDVAVSSLTSILEPLLILGLGITVGFIVMALFLPLITLLDRLSK